MIAIGILKDIGNGDRKLLSEIRHSGFKMEVTL